MQSIIRGFLPALLCGLLLLAGCGSGGGSDEISDDSFDEASRLVNVKGDIQDLQCECAMQAGDYTSISKCKADLFKLEPARGAQCLRDVFDDHPRDLPAVKCEISAFEDLASCSRKASCNTKANGSCLFAFLKQQRSCPTGPATNGDSFGIQMTNGVTFPAFPGLTLDMPPVNVSLVGEDYYPFSPLAKLPSFVNDDDDLLNDEVDSLSSGSLRDVNSKLEYQFKIKDFTVQVDPIESFKYVYTASGTLKNTAGADVNNWHGLPFNISVKQDLNTAPDSVKESASLLRATWAVTTDFHIDAPMVPGGFTASAPGQLLATDSRFDAWVESCQNLPGDQMASVFADSFNANFKETCRCSPDTATREACRSDAPSPRKKCFAQVVKLDPAAAEVAKCVIEEFDDQVEGLDGIACCANPGDLGCMSRTLGTNGGSIDQKFNFCASSDTERDAAEALLFCMGDAPPPPPPSVDFSADPAQCDNTTMLASGTAGDVMVFTQTRVLNPMGLPYPRFYAIFDLAQFSELATLDAAQPLLTALHAIDNDSSAKSKDSCALPNIVSIAMDGDTATPPDLGSINTRINDIQNGLVNLPMFIAMGKQQAEEFAQELYQDLVCPAFVNMTDSIKISVPNKPIVSSILTLGLKQALLKAVKC